MKVLLVCLSLVAASAALPVRVKRGHEHHEHATSYQNFNLESYHPVPVYTKHEHKEYEHQHSDGGLGQLSLGEHEGHGAAEAYSSLGLHGLGHGLGEGSYQRASLTDGGGDHGEAYGHQGAVAEVEEAAEEGYEGHGTY